MANGTFYVTTPIYYVNDKPHIGHAYTTILADVLARYHRLFGEETFFLTGVDEHGQKVEEAARKRGVTPQQHCDELSEKFRALWPTLDVTNDDFIRTTEPRHERVVAQALQRLWDAGEIYRGEYEGFYSPRVEKFFSEEELVDGKCPETGGEVFKLKEANYFFRMGKYRERLVEHLRANPGFIVPESRRNEVLGFLGRPLQDLCISRPKSRLAWGIPLPFDADYVTYVWFDALINYVSAIGLHADEARFGRLWPHCNHLIGKDILTTHCVYWTTMLMALGIPLPRRIVAHGWWLVDQTKMSKSLGNVIDPLALRDKYGVDSLRYFLMREMVVGLDADFSEEAFLRRHNYDLANDVGNLANRVVKFVQRSLGGKVPAPGVADAARDAEVRAQAEALPGRVRELVGGIRIEAAIEQTMALVRRVNRYVAETEPFKRVKDDPANAAASCYNALEALRFALHLLWPVMPSKCEQILAGIGAGAPVSTLADLRWGALVPGTPLTLDAPPFPRHEVPALGGPSPAGPTHSPGAAGGGGNAAGRGTAGEGPSPSGAARIPYDAFAKIDLRVATVLTAESVPGAKKLVKLSVDAGESAPRRLVAGIAEAYKPEDLVGRQLIVVANLEPRKVFGIESNGMILAAHDDAGLAIVAPIRSVQPGGKVS
ncbi:MAG: methionine--tRNA ligase [Deltaproteobacteria bacterium]|nr:methionine--tRNA ligase [Deltaproteobacteria bacterium]